MYQPQKTTYGTLQMELSTSLETNYELVRRVCKIANSSPNLTERLQMVVDLVSEKMQTDVCSVYLLGDNSNLVLKASKGLHRDSVDHVELKMGQGITGAAASQMKTIFSSDPQAHPKFFYIPITREEKFQSIISTPIMSNNECIGVINVQTLEKRDFTPSDINTMETLAEQLSGIIKNSQLYEKNSSNLRDLTIIHDMGRKINSTLKLPDLLETITNGCCEILESDCSALWLMDDSGNFEMQSSHGNNSLQRMVQNFKIIENQQATPGHICSINLPDVFQKLPEKEIKIFCSIPKNLRNRYICLPLLSQSQLIGMLSVYRERPFSRVVQFSETEIRLLALLANQAGLAIDNALTHQRLENLNSKNQVQLRELNILYESTRALETEMNLDKCLRMILHSVTVGDGLGFNRAILFLLSDDGLYLQGMLGVGPSSAEEAKKIWQKLSNQKTSHLFEWLIQCGEKPDDSHSSFNELAKSLRIPMNSTGCVLARTALEKKSFNIKDAQKNKEVNQELMKKLNCHNFATVPLVANDRTLGIILVDNLYSGVVISDADLQFLVHFASQAGWAIQNSSIFTKLTEVNRELLLTQKKLIESEHFAALGELSAEIAHEIKNPLLPIGGFARRLLEKLEEGNSARKYARIILDEVLRLEELLSNVLSYTKKIEPNFNVGNINSVIMDVIHLMKPDIEDSGIRLTSELEDEIPDTYFDQNQIKQVITNLFSNAIESMSNSGGELKIVTRKGAGNNIILKVSDTGGGMPQEVSPKIFNSFFTTKKSGTGIGLPLVKKIIESHNGIIEVVNVLGTGVELVINLPYNLPLEKKETDNGN